MMTRTQASVLGRRQVLGGCLALVAGCGSSAARTAGSTAAREPAAPPGAPPRPPTPTCESGLRDTALSDREREVLQGIVEEGRRQDSTAIVVLRGAECLVEAYADGYDCAPLAAMSASKSVTSMAIGHIIASGSLSLDTAVATVIPEWRGDGRSEITVRHLLSHTSGLDPRRADRAKETIRARAAASALTSAPGALFRYNNNAVDVLAVVAAEVTGLPLDAYLQRHILGPLGIEDASWEKDAEGTPGAAGELFIKPMDLAKLGMLMAGHGRWEGAQILAEDWVRASVVPSQDQVASCGLLWWREGRFAFVLTPAILDELVARGLSSAAQERLRPLVMQPFREHEGYLAALNEAVGEERLPALTMEPFPISPFGSVEVEEPLGFSARGWLGQYLVVLPGRSIVGVRMRRPTDADYENSAQEVSAYPTFSRDLAMLVR